jgi:hypothetical protein
MGTQSDGKDAAKYPVGQDACHEGEQCGGTRFAGRSARHFRAFDRLDCGASTFEDHDCRTRRHHFIVADRPSSIQSPRSCIPGPVGTRKRVWRVRHSRRCRRRRCWAAGAPGRNSGLKVRKEPLDWLRLECARHTRSRVCRHPRHSEWRRDFTSAGKRPRSMLILGAYPLVMVAVFTVPLSFMLHFLSVWQFRRWSANEATAMRPSLEHNLALQR